MDGAKQKKGLFFALAVRSYLFGSRDLLIAWLLIKVVTLNSNLEDLNKKWVENS